MTRLFLVSKFDHTVSLEEFLLHNVTGVHVDYGFLNYLGVVIQILGVLDKFGLIALNAAGKWLLETLKRAILNSLRPLKGSVSLVFRLFVTLCLLLLSFFELGYLASFLIIGNTWFMVDRVR